MKGKILIFFLFLFFFLLIFWFAFNILGYSNTTSQTEEEILKNINNAQLVPKKNLGQSSIGLERILEHIPRGFETIVFSNLSNKEPLANSSIEFSGQLMDNKKEKYLGALEGDIIVEVGRISGECSGILFSLSEYSTAFAIPTSAENILRFTVPESKVRMKDGKFIVALNFDGPANNVEIHFYWRSYKAENKVGTLSIDKIGRYFFYKNNQSQLYYIDLREKVSFSSLDNPDGVDQTQILVSIDNGKIISYSPGIILPFDQLDEGKHTITLSSIDRAGNKSRWKELNFIVDKTPPEVELSYPEDNPPIKKNGILYIGLNHKIQFVARDKPIPPGLPGSGVSSIFYSKGNSFELYQPGNNINLVPNSMNYVQVYAIDHLGNKSDSKYFTFYFDANPPTITISYKYSLLNNWLSRMDNKYYVQANDPEKGPVLITVKLDGVAFQYKGEFMVPRLGEHNIEVIATDNVQNRSYAKLFFECIPIQDYTSRLNIQGTGGTQTLTK